MSKLEEYTVVKCIGEYTNQLIWKQRRKNVILYVFLLLYNVNRQGNILLRQLGHQ